MNSFYYTNGKLWSDNAGIIQLKTLKGAIKRLKNMVYLPKGTYKVYNNVRPYAIDYEKENTLLATFTN